MQRQIMLPWLPWRMLSDGVITIQALAQLDTSGIRSAKSWEFVPLEALTLECGILIPHTMVTVDKDGTVPVTLRLAFGQDMILAKGTVLGTLRTTQHIVSVRSISRNVVDPQPSDDGNKGTTGGGRREVRSVLGKDIEGVTAYS